MRILTPFLAGASLAFLAGCGNDERLSSLERAINEQGKKMDALQKAAELSNPGKYAHLSNGAIIPRNVIARITHFIDHKEGKEVTAYYFAASLDTFEEGADAFMAPPAIYDIGDGKPFVINYDTLEGRSFRIYLENQREVDSAVDNRTRR